MTWLLKWLNMSIATLNATFQPSKRIDVVIPQLNHPAYINIYIDVRRGRKTERLLLEAKTEAETIEQEDEIVGIKRWGRGRN